MENKVLVATWGYSMVLKTYVQVIKESNKSLLVQEIESRCYGPEELKEAKLTTGYLQAYSVPMLGKFRTVGMSMGKPFRIYKRENSDGSYWRGTPPQISSTLNFFEWNGKPQFEDHCD